MASIEAALPEGFRLRSASGTLTISWKGPTHWVFVLIGALGAVVSGILLASVVFASRRLTGAPFVFGAGLFASGYVFLLGLCNRTRVRVCEGRMQARHGPLPCIFPWIFHVGCRKGIPISLAFSWNAFTFFSESERNSRQSLSCAKGANLKVSQERGAVLSARIS